MTRKFIYQYTFTKAICNKTNYDENYIIECEDTKLRKLTPTGLSIQHNEEQIDPRPEKELCEY